MTKSRTQFPSQQQLATTLEQSEARFQRLAASVPGVIYQLRRLPDGSFDFPILSSGCQRIFGVAPQTIQPCVTQLLNLIHPDDRSLFERSLTVSAQTLQSWQWEGRIILKTEEIKWLQTTAQPERQPNGEILWDGLLLDITHYKQTEAALRESEQRFWDVSNAAGEYLWEIDAHGIYTFVTERTKSVKGYAPEELLGHSPFEFMPPEDVEPVQTILHKACACRDRFKLEHRNITSTGEVLWEEVSGIPLLNLQGEIVGFRGTGLSINDRKHADTQIKAALQQLEYQADLLRNIIDSSLDWIAIKDHNFRYLLVNRSFAAAMGKPVEELLGKDELDLGLSPQQVLGNSEQGIVGFRVDDRKALAGETVFNPGEPVTLTDGTLEWVETQKLPLRDDTRTSWAS